MRREDGTEARMYSSQCGAKADGKFCSQFGAPLNDTNRSTDFSVDWSAITDYEELLLVREVRELIARHAAMAKKRMSAEDFLSLCDNLFSPFKGVSSKTVVGIAQPLFAKLGVKTGNTRSQVFDRPIGRIIVGALCSLARHGRPITQARPLPDCCALEATLPSDVYSSDATVAINISRIKASILVEATATVPGQIYNWGKSKRCLDDLFADLGAAEPTAQMATEPK
jgi:hypothetical protein